MLTELTLSNDIWYFKAKLISNRQNMPLKQGCPLFGLKKAPLLEEAVQYVQEVI